MDTTIINEAKGFISEHWGNSANRVFAACDGVTPFGGTSGQFLDYCTACGGNWCAMWLSGIKRLYPRVYEAIPNQMGHRAFECICYLLILLGVDTSK